MSGNPAHPDCQPNMPNPGDPLCEPIVSVPTTADPPGPNAVPMGEALTGLNRVAATCAITNGRAYVFPSTPHTLLLSDPTTGEVGGQTVTLDDTRLSGLGNHPPGHTVPPLQNGIDGFLLRGGGCGGVDPNLCQLIVFMGDLPPSGFAGLAAGGFILNASGATDSPSGAAHLLVGTPAPTKTPTVAATPTPTLVPPTSTPNMDAGGLCACHLHPESNGRDVGFVLLSVALVLILRRRSP